MKYEIQKRSETDKRIWYLIAKADTLEWASNIVESLCIVQGGQYRVVEICN